MFCTTIDTGATSKSVICLLKREHCRMKSTRSLLLGVSAVFATVILATAPAVAQQKRPNIVMLMTDDTGWNDFGAYSNGGAALGHPTPNVDQIAKEGAVFTSWYGQASCTAGRASFITGRIPVRSALSIVVAPGDENCPPQGNANDRGVLQEERLHDVLLRQMASGRQARVVSDRARLRRDEEFCGVLRRRLHLRLYRQVVPSLVPVVQSAIRQDVQRKREFG